MSESFLDLESWPEGIAAARIPANNNVRTLEAFIGAAISATTAAQPASPAERDIYILPASPTGAMWGGFDEGDVVIYYEATWTAYAPFDGLRKFVADEVEDWQYTEGTDGGWAAAGGGGVVATWGAIIGTLADQTDLVAALAAASPVGLHSVPVMAGAIQPSVAGGSSALASIASAANQPDIVTLDFDPTTQEYAQFSIPMPKSWNEGTITAAFRWSHAATTTNFGVVWNIQAVAVSDDDTIAVNFGTAQQIADTGGTTNDLYITSQTPAITVGGSPAAQDTVFFRVSRVTGDGSDTMAIDARLHSVVLYMTTDASTDA